MLRMVSRVFPWLFLVGGIASLAILYKHHSERSLIIKEGLHVSGTVQWSSSYNKQCSSSIRVTYLDRDGREFTKYFNVCSNLFRPGQGVDVIFLRADPNEAALMEPEAAPSKAQETIGAAVGVVFALVGTALLIAFRQNGAQRF